MTALKRASRGGERIAAAAIRFPVPEQFRGQMYRGKPVYPEHLIVTAPPPARHGTLMHPTYESLGTPLLEDQGFITDTGRFVGRKEAVKIAQAAGQIIEKTGGADDLYSEDMW